MESESGAAASGTALNVAEAFRGTGSLLTQGFSGTRLSLLAVDSDKLDQAAWFRSDFAGGQTLSQLAAELNPASNGAVGVTGAGNGGNFGDGIELPRDATMLAVWANPGRPGTRLTLKARLRDSRGYHFDSFLGEPEARGWQRLSGELVPAPSRSRDPEPPELSPPFTLLNLQVASRVGINEPGILFLDELTAETPGGEQVVADFQTLEGWQVIEDYTRPGLYALESSAAVARAEGRRSVAFSWAPGGVGLRGIRPGLAAEPVPVIVSPEVLDIANAESGDVMTLSVSTFAFPVRIAAVADYFPTLDPREQPFVVLDLETFNRRGHAHGRRLAAGPNEVWVGADDPYRAESLITAALDDRGLRIDESLLAADEIRLRVGQPLANASWSGLLALMFLALALASASGVILFSYIDTGERRTEFALLRTLGSSAGQLNGMVWFNLLLVMVCGVALGTWAGQQIGSAILPVLEVAEGGVRVTPPMALQTNWLTLLAAYPGAGRGSGGQRGVAGLVHRSAGSAASAPGRGSRLGYWSGRQEERNRKGKPNS